MVDFLAQQVDHDFKRARWQARQSAFWHWLGRRPIDLLSFSEVRTHIAIRGQRDGGVQTVPIKQIIGSEGRAYDFDRSFMPRSDRVEQRWKLVARAYYQDIPLPPIDLSKLGAIYFVSDGHHRLSVARLRGQQEIEAHSIDFHTDVPLTPALDWNGLVRKGAQSTFLEWTNLVRLRPGAVIPIEASEPTTYRNLRHHIEGHRYFMQLAQGAPVGQAETIVHWYDQVYLPHVTAIRESGIVKAFGDRTETCLYLATMEHRYYLSERTGQDPGPETAVRDYVLHFGPWQARRHISREADTRLSAP